MVFVSDVASFAICPRIVYNRRVLGIYCDSTLWQALGSFEHEVRRRFYSILRRLPNLEELTQNALFQIARRSIEETHPYALLNYAYPYSLENFKDNIADRLAREVEKLNSKDNLPYLLEYSLSSTNLGLTGRIDCVYKTPEGFYPLDFKVCKKPLESLPHELQIVAYAMLMEEKLNCSVKFGVILYTLDEHFLIVKTSDKHRGNVTETICLIKHMLEKNKKPDIEIPRPECFSCHYGMFCIQEILK